MRTIGKLIAMTFLVGLLPQILLAQGRSGVYLRAPGEMNRVGAAGASSNFRDYSYGLGSLSRNSAASSDVLRSTMSSSSNYNFLRKGTYDPSDPSSISKLSAPPSGTYTKRPGGAAGFGGMRNMGGPGTMQTLLKTLGKGGLGGPSGAYLSAITTMPSSKTEGDEIITTLVPVDPSVYKMHMERGENAFRNAEFHRAFGEFEIAKDIGGDDDWMSLVNMINARFAVSAYSYFSAAFYARQAIKSMPELPLVPLRPKEFYGNKMLFSDAVVQLQGRVDDFPYDADAAFLLAYFRWFEPNPVEAQKALTKSLSAAKAAGNDEKIRAVEAFWRGMVATGKVEGELKPVELPPLLPPLEPTTQTQPFPAQGPETVDHSELFWPTTRASRPATTSKPADE